MEFVHLHVHSHFSLLDGLNRIDEMLARAKELGMSSLALTDHGNLYGAVEFYKEAKKAGVKPILGIECYISPTTRQDRSMGNQSDATNHLLLLAMNRTGWRNLMKLSSRAFLEGFYYKPRIDRELLSQFNEGLVCSSACLAGEIPSALLQGDYKKAKRIAGEYLDIFGRDRFFIEIMNQGEADQDKVNPDLVRLARELNVGLVGTNDVHFLQRTDKAAHKVLTCISTNKLLSDTDGLEYSAELYLKSGAEMQQAMAEWPEAMRNTLRIAEMCDSSMDEGEKHLPVFRPPDNQPADDYLEKLAWEGLGNRFKGAEIPGNYRERLSWELKVIRDKGYSSYFLIVNDFVQFARRNEIPAAPRGSGVATLLGYALGIANIDPLRYGLLFERFTDPQRQEDPDIDIDMCQEGREKVIQYVRQKYGHVAQIITYGTLKPRNAIRDVGRVLNIPLPEVDRLAKLVPESPDMEFRHVFEESKEEKPAQIYSQSEELRREYANNPQYREIIDYARKLEGLSRHAGVHAAGVVICDEPLEQFVPLCKQAKSDDAIIQWDGETCGWAGMMKMDFLGLRTLTIIERARKLVRQHRGQDVDPEELPLDDQKVFEVFREGRTDGVFQFEGDGMKNVLRQMQPNRIEDLIAANAMFRPGPMELIPSYCLRKKNEEPIAPVHPLVDDILAETYGIMIYQEQIMQVLNRLGKLPLNKALTMIKAISKKKLYLIEKETASFMKGAQENGIEKQQADNLFELIKKFAGYGFNKAHSTRYAIIAYQAAYFKVHFAQEFIAATLTYECADRDKVVQYMSEATRMGVIVAPPDVNSSGSTFTVDGKQVRFGLTAVKGVGQGAVEAIVQAREKVGRFQNLFHFCEHVDPRAINRTAIEALIKCGAFDSAGSAHRAAMIAAIDSAVQSAQSVAHDREKGQLNFFDNQPVTDKHSQASYPNVKQWTIEEILAAEKETIGFYVSAHPLTQYAGLLTGLNWPHGFTLGLAARCQGDERVGVGCMVTACRVFVPKRSTNGKKMAMMTLEDLHGKAEGVVFADFYEKIGGLLKNDALLYVTGTIDRSRPERINLRIDNVWPVALAGRHLATAIRIVLPAVGVNVQTLNQIKDVIRKYPGEFQVEIEMRLATDPDSVVGLQTGREYYAVPEAGFVREMEAIMNGLQVKFNINPPTAVISRRRDFHRSNGG